MIDDMSRWTPRQFPPRVMLEGRYVRLEPLDAARHAAELFAASNVADKVQKFRFMFDAAPEDEEQVSKWCVAAAQKQDPLYYVVIDCLSGKVGGRQALMRIDTTNGVIEIGSIYWGPGIARQRGATEALYLFMRHVFEDLDYRRFEWKCHNDNLPSRKAAARFGFTYEGVFRQHMVIKGENRDTAWFSIIDSEWPRLKGGYECWLDPSNFDAEGVQLRSLGACLSR